MQNQPTYGTDFRQRSRDTQGNNRDKNPTVQDGDSLSIGQSDIERRAEAERDRHNCKAKAKDAQHRQIPGQLALVTKLCQSSIALGMVARRASAPLRSLQGWPS